MTNNCFATASNLIRLMLFYYTAEIEDGDSQVKADAIRIGNYTDGRFPTDSKEFAKRIFYTVYMGSENRFACVTYLLSLAVFLPCFYHGTILFPPS